MRMHSKFSRWKNGAVGTTALGSDAVPGAPVYATSAPVPVASDGTLDNAMSHRFLDANGWPAHRVAVVLNYKGVGTPVALPATLYVYDSLTQRWYQLGPTTDLVDGKVTFFDTLGISQRGPADSTQDVADMTPGAEQLLLIVNDTSTASAPNGEYQIAWAPDLTTIGY